MSVNGVSSVSNNVLYLNELFLSQFNHTGQGSICSQAIMLITDGAVDTYDTIFAKYNWPDRKVSIFSLAFNGKTKLSYPV